MTNWVVKNGVLAFSGPTYAADGSASAPSIAFASDTNTGFFWESADLFGWTNAGTQRGRIHSDGLIFHASNYLAWGSSGVTSTDLFLFRDAANTLAQRNGTNAQLFRIYNTYANAGTDFERAGLYWQSNSFIVGTSAGGTGSARQMIFETGGSSRWLIGTSGHFLAGTDNTYDIGASEATRPRNLYVAQQGTFGSNVEVAAAGYLAPSGRTKITAPSDGVMLLSNNAVTDFSRLQFGGTTSSFPALKRNSTQIDVRLADDSAGAGLSAASFLVNASGTPFIRSTAPTISSGFGTSPSIVASNGTAAFTINVGTGGSASTGVIGLPAATTGWCVTCQNTSANTATVFITKQTAFTTTTATIGNYDAAGAAAAWTASNVLVCKAMAF